MGLCYCGLWGSVPAGHGALFLRAMGLCSRGPWGSVPAGYGALFLRAMGLNPLCISTLSIYLWSKFPIDNHLTLCVSGAYLPRSARRDASQLDPRAQTNKKKETDLKANRLLGQSLDIVYDADISR